MNPIPKAKAESPAGSSCDTESGAETGPQEICDADLVAAAIREDSGARAAIFHRHGPAMYKLATRFIGNPVAAEDILHDAFIYAFEHFAELRKPSALKSWLSQVLVRKALMFLRREKTRRRIGLSTVVMESAYVPAQALDLHETDALEDARRLLERLAPEPRIVWWLQRVEGHSIQEIADLTNLTVDRVKKRLSIAERKMRAYRREENR